MTSNNTNRNTNMFNLNLPQEAMFKGPAVVWKRIGAFAIDLMVIDLVIGSPLEGIIASIMPKGTMSENFAFFSANPKVAATLSLFTFIVGILALLYFALMEWKLNQTIGKMFFGIWVESDTGKMTFMSCVIRSIFMFFIFPFYLLAIIDPLFMFFSKDKRRLSEVLSGTRTFDIYSLNN